MNAARRDGEATAITTRSYPILLSTPRPGRRTF